MVLGRVWSGALSWWGLALWYVLFRTPDLIDLHFFPVYFSGDHHIGLSPVRETTSVFGLRRLRNSRAKSHEQND